MSPDGAALPHETPPETVEIRQDASITVAEALTVAASIPLPLGRSTLQRWAKHWAALGPASPVPCVLVATRTGSLYRIDREAFAAWCLTEAENGRPREAPLDLERPQETSGDPMRSRETSRDPVRPQETSRGSRAEAARDEGESERLQALEDENLQLRIDLGIRKELIARAREELNSLRHATDGLLRENGALEFRLRQLTEPQRYASLARPADETVEPEPIEDIPSDGGNGTHREPDALY